MNERFFIWVLIQHINAFLPLNTLKFNTLKFNTLKKVNKLLCVCKYAAYYLAASATFLRFAKPESMMFVTASAADLSSWPSGIGGFNL